MKIYLGHSRGEFDYETELYQPIKASPMLSSYNIILPHDGTTKYNQPDFYKTLDLFIAEVSFPATGLGIELGWAYDAKVPIVCISKSGSRVSGSLSVLTDELYEYHDSEELIALIEKIINHHQ